MPKFFNRDMADLAHQLTLSPRRLRMGQVHAIDRLLGLVDSTKSYPFEFVCFSITKFRKRGPSTGASIPGKALICDLATLAETLTRKASLPITELGEEFLTHEQLASELQVSTKTVRRWRSRGLMGLRVVFADGVNRLAFCRSTVDRFVKQHAGLVERGASFSQLSESERHRIIALARELISTKPMKLHAAAKLLAEQTGRAVETIRYTLRRHDESDKATALFAGGGSVLHCERHEAIWKCHEAGDSVESIASAYETTVDEIHGVLRAVQIELWERTPLEWVHNELFDAPNADGLILEAAEPVAAATPLPKAPTDLPPYLKALYATPLLSREQEADLFRRYNYLKCKATKLVKVASQNEVTVGAFDAIRQLRSQVEDVRQRITRANLRLVVSIAKRHAGWKANFFEIISDGNMSLMRAIEKFDYARGNKFSTYATWAVMKNYARSIPEQHYQNRRFVTGQDEVLDAVAQRETETISESDRVRVRELIDAGLGELSDREREVVHNHFALGGEGTGETLEQIGKRFGVTKERVRQIELRALTRLREILSPSLGEARA